MKFGLFKRGRTRRRGGTSRLFLASPRRLRKPSSSLSKEEEPSPSTQATDSGYCSVVDEVDLALDADRGDGPPGFKRQSSASSLRRALTTSMSRQWSARSQARLEIVRWRSNGNYQDESAVLVPASRAEADFGVARSNLTVASANRQTRRLETGHSRSADAVLALRAREEAPMGADEEEVMLIQTPPRRGHHQFDNNEDVHPRDEIDELLSLLHEKEDHSIPTPYRAPSSSSLSPRSRSRSGSSIRKKPSRGSPPQGQVQRRVNFAAAEDHKTKSVSTKQQQHEQQQQQLQQELRQQHQKLQQLQQHQHRHLRSRGSAGEQQAVSGGGDKTVLGWLWDAPCVSRCRVLATSLLSTAGQPSTCNECSCGAMVLDADERHSLDADERHSSNNSIPSTVVATGHKDD